MDQDIVFDLLSPQVFFATANSRYWQGTVSNCCLEPDIERLEHKPQVMTSVERPEAETRRQL